MAKPAERLCSMSAGAPNPESAMAGMARLYAKAPHQLEPAAVGELDVADDDVELGLGRPGVPRPYRRPCGRDIRAARGAGEVFEGIVVIFDQEDLERPGRAWTAASRDGAAGASAVGRRRAGGGAVGISMVKVAPSPAPGLWAVSRPPCCSRIERLMVRPSPNPPKRRVVEIPPCSRTSKMRGKTSGSMPMPVSLTSINEVGSAVWRGGACVVDCVSGR